MNIDIRTRAQHSSTALRSFAETLLADRIGAHHKQVVGASIQLDDVNGPRGGEDKRCRVILRLRNKPVVVVSKSAADWYDAVIEATAAAREVLRKVIGRRRARRTFIQELPDAA